MGQVRLPKTGESAISSGSATVETLVLGPRETEAVMLVAQGLCDRDVAERMGLQYYTVKEYLHRIYERNGLGRYGSPRVALTVWAWTGQLP